MLLITCCSIDSRTPSRSCFARSPVCIPFSASQSESPPSAFSVSPTATNIVVSARYCKILRQYDATVRRYPDKHSQVSPASFSIAFFLPIQCILHYFFISSIDYWYHAGILRLLLQDHHAVSHRETRFSSVLCFIFLFQQCPRTQQQQRRRLGATAAATASVSRQQTSRLSVTGRRTRV